MHCHSTSLPFLAFPSPCGCSLSVLCYTSPFPARPILTHLSIPLDLLHSPPFHACLLLANVLPLSPCFTLPISRQSHSYPSFYLSRLATLSPIPRRYPPCGTLPVFCLSIRVTVAPFLASLILTPRSIYLDVLFPPSSAVFSLPLFYLYTLVTAAPFPARPLLTPRSISLVLLSFFLLSLLSSAVSLQSFYLSILIAVAPFFALVFSFSPRYISLYPSHTLRTVNKSTLDKV